jgi:hypothetical protein
VEEGGGVVKGVAGAERMVVPTPAISEGWVWFIIIGTAPRAAMNKRANKLRRTAFFLLLISSSDSIV